MTDIKIHCPFCKEDIKVEAIRCKHCQSDLSNSSDRKSGCDCEQNQDPSTMMRLQGMRNPGLGGGINPELCD